MIWSSLLLAFAGMVLLILAFLLLARRRQDRVQNPLLVFEQKLQLLAQARSQGELAEPDFEQAAADLKTEYLQREQLQAVQHKTNQGWLWGTVLSVLIASVALYSLTGHYSQLQQWQQAKDNLPSYGERALLNKGEPLTEQEVQLFSLALRSKIAAEGDDAVAWFVIGRIALSKGMAADAIDAFEKALQLTPNRVNLLVSYSQALLVQGGEESLGKAGRALARVLQQEPDNTDALSMLGMVAEERGDLEQARQAWTLLLPKLSQDDPRYALIQQKLAQQDTLASGPVIELQLTIPDLLYQAYQNATLFVFVKATDGPPLPLAVKRLPAFKGEQRIRLTDQDAMQQGWALSNAKQVQISARLSLSGQVLNDEKGPQVSSEAMTLTEKPLQLSLTLQP
ncbi:c-type cytochrome biogenesis protein CcmI [Rheinheimera sp.]|uniref:c-type cytochrome biogenesis protein CcmI n=1 Tax=Rheinheimera sp. TaxID=1869214 RepID=UPI003AF8D2D6